ncbi:hypothetical protein DOTSEDRAFT_57842 [Dothistroma septosporum NZE10]|uniref:Uncharacterized protein n=1 Tax=Dothistroma septosporum (strain NZE10 / CBS 128990) TaxID=675120 RepID=N1PYB0_DOTSN|nr:hypothetical protein DOTSEDRAFT_57842 [Dothistroma septosporum NZE10]
MSLRNQTILITGASMGIGACIAYRLAREQANLILLARSSDKLSAVAKEIQPLTSGKVIYLTADVQDHAQVDDAVKKAAAQFGHIDILVNNAGLAIGAPAAFPDLRIDQINTMVNTNISGFMYAIYAVLNSGKMQERKAGTILNITSTTALEVPPFPGEAVYHASKASQEAFTNVLRTELQGTNIKVQALRPGVVATNFHDLRVGYDRQQYDDFMAGMEPLVADDVAEAAAYVLSQGERVTIKALDVVPTAQRSLQVFDRTWKERNGK